MADRRGWVPRGFWTGVLGAVLLQWLAAGSAAALPGPGLPYSTTRAEAGAPARYGFLLPEEATTLWAPGESWTLVFDAALDVAAYRRRLRLCYVGHSSGVRPLDSRCVESIPAAFRVRTGPGEDTLTLTPSRALDPNRSLGVWVDLLNPWDPGTYDVQLLQGERPVGRWHLRVEQPGFDSPGSSD